jgi:glutamate--cysteine ligase catalytic subunit
MGFLHESKPMSWEEQKAILQYVRKHGIEQFLSVLERCKDSKDAPFKWGDEVEHQVFHQDSASGPGRTARVSLRSPEILAELQALGLIESNWMPEYGRWMLESTPGKPYNGLDGVKLVESQLALRRSQLNKVLKPGEVAPTLTAFSRFGAEDFCQPTTFTPNGPVMQSLFLPDEVIFPHPRFPTLAQNIRERRGSKVSIRRPLMVDRMTKVPKHIGLDFVPTTVEEADSMDHVYADAMAFGMGSSCLQVTMQASNILESRFLYDQLAPLTPVLLALTAATPFLRGWICDDDVRWGQISQSVDDRTPAERGLVAPAQASINSDARLAGSGAQPLRKSRYDGIDCYISDAKDMSLFNDLPMVMDEQHLARLKEAGVDDALAQHVAHLFARDPLVVFADRLELDDGHDIDHWENIQSTNWQTLRWKPPPPHKGALNGKDEDHIGWRVEFRSMEIQMSDFENAAFISFVVLLSRVILDQKLDLRIPISKLDENMRTAGHRNACTEERFWFRTNPLSGESSDPTWEKLTINEILSGAGSYRGLISLCQEFLTRTNCDNDTRQLLDKYLDFISQRARGSLLTPATWMRRFVAQHEAYRQDSRVPAAAAHDLITAANEIGEGRQQCSELLGSFDAKIQDTKMPTNCCDSDCSTEYADYSAQASQLELLEMEEKFGVPCA